MDFAANTHIIAHAGRTLATVEAGPLPYELTYELDTVGPSDFGGSLPGGFAAHTKLDHRTGELHAIAYFWAWDHVQHVIVDGAGNVARTTDIPVADGPMMHDFALTSRYVVLLDLPVTFSLGAGCLHALGGAWTGHAGPVDHRPGRRHSVAAAAGRPRAGVPARGRPAYLPATSPPATSVWI
jgi:carotenoid cleavage dioxygenase-like enzyme